MRAASAESRHAGLSGAQGRKAQCLMHERHTQASKNRDPVPKVAVLHGAGYAGRELIRILVGHPEIELTVVTSRAFVGRPVHHVHPDLRGVADLTFMAPEAVDHGRLDGVLIAAEHGKSAQVVLDLLNGGYGGAIIDLSADFRLKESTLYGRWYGFEHPAPSLLSSFGVWIA